MFGPDLGNNGLHAFRGQCPALAIVIESGIQLVSQSVDFDLLHDLAEQFQAGTRQLVHLLVQRTREARLVSWPLRWLGHTRTLSPAWKCDKPPG